MPIGNPPVAIGNALSSATSATLTTTGAVPSGGKIIVVTMAGSDPGTPVITVGGGGLTWTRDAQFTSTEGTVNYEMCFWSANTPSGLATSTGLSLTSTGSPFGFNAYALYDTGLATSSYVDGTPAETFRATPTGTWTTPTLVTSNADDLLLAFALSDDSGTGNTSGVPTNSFAELVEAENTALAWDGVVLWRIVSATGSYSTGATWGTGAPNFSDSAGIIAYKADAGATPAPLTGTAAGIGSATGALSAGVTYMGAGAAATATSGNVTAAYPSGLALATNDVLICDVSARDNVSLTFPAGWTKKAELNNGTDLRQTVAWKRRAGGDSDVDVLVTHAAGAQIIARVHVIRGAVSTGDPFEATGGPTAVAAATTGTFPSATTVSPGDLLFYAMAYGDDYTVAPSVTNAQGLTLTDRDSTEVP